MSDSAEGRPPVDETRPSGPPPDRDGSSPDPSGKGAGMGLGEADTFEPEESAPDDPDHE